jgi:hypothetical protein
MKIEKMTYKDRPIGMTADHTSRPDKVLFFADPHFLFSKSRLTFGTLPFAETLANASQKSKSQIFPTHKLKVNIIKF